MCIRIPKTQLNSAYKLLNSHTLKAINFHAVETLDERNCIAIFFKALGEKS